MGACVWVRVFVCCTCIWRVAGGREGLSFRSQESPFYATFPFYDMLYPPHKRLRAHDTGGYTRARTCALSPGSGCSVHRIRTPRYAVLTPEARDRNSLARHGLQSTRTSGPCAAPPSSPLKSLAVSRASRNAREGGGGEVRHFRMRHANTFRLRPHKPVTGARWGKQPGRMSRQSRTRPTFLVCGDMTGWPGPAEIHNVCH